MSTILIKVLCNEKTSIMFNHVNLFIDYIFNQITLGLFSKSS